MNDFSKIINPLTNEKLSIFSSSGKNLLKNYVKLYKNGGQVGGVAPALEFDSINLNFTNLNDDLENFNLDLNRNSTVLEIKNIISGRFNVPVALFYENVEGFLPNNMRLNEIFEDGDGDGETIEYWLNPDLH